ncbi:hypothetical protein BZG36_01185 [Bifiguratus adelaidae]|uniref:Casein kinase II subunit beta n=1 Tax=Bifiguratus adelaidae TaxID=1938954 RepID=A0A261Y5R8_9FUNG|nr:hypothetical protein BZG36_01185 [Bifiguratus adelaidae]
MEVTEGVLTDVEDSEVEDDYASWIDWFCSSVGNEIYARVPEEFIQDDFNLTGLAAQVPEYEQALSIILDMEFSDDESYNSGRGDVLECSAQMLYGLIHARYIITRQGLQQMVEKYEMQVFGVCPRVFCQKIPVVPMGASDMAGIDTLHFFCPSCLDVYEPANELHASIDGAHFGTTFPHLLFHTFPYLSPPPTEYVYQPKIFGFRVNERSRAGPRMTWLRMFDVSQDPSEQNPGGGAISTSDDVQHMEVGTPTQGHHGNGCESNKPSTHEVSDQIMTNANPSVEKLDQGDTAHHHAYPTRNNIKRTASPKVDIRNEVLRLKQN